MRAVAEKLRESAELGDSVVAECVRKHLTVILAALELADTCKELPERVPYHWRYQRFNGDAHRAYVVAELEDSPRSSPL